MTHHRLLLHWLAVSITGLMLVTTPGYAEDGLAEHTLQFDPAQPQLDSLDFQQTKPLTPAKSDFKLISSSFMSNELGERWALVTVQNLSNGQRIIKNQHMVATFADGSQAYAKNLEAAIAGNAQLSRAVQFGVNKFPIVSITLR